MVDVDKAKYAQLLEDQKKLQKIKDAHKKAHALRNKRISMMCERAEAAGIPWPTKDEVLAELAKA